MQEKLTPRELEAARIAAAGATNKEVAQRMGLTVGTVKQYLHQAFEKTASSTRGDLLYKISEPGGESPK